MKSYEVLNNNHIKKKCDERKRRTSERVRFNTMCMQSLPIKPILISGNAQIDRFQI